MTNVLFVPGLIYPKCSRWSMRVDGMGNDPVQGSLINVTNNQIRKLCSSLNMVYKLQDEECFFVLGAKVVQANTSPENFYEIIKDIGRNLLFWIRTQDMEKEEVKLGYSLTADTAPYFLFDLDKSIRVSIAEILAWTLESEDKTREEVSSSRSNSDNQDEFFYQTMREFDILMSGLRSTTSDISNLRHFVRSHDAFRSPLTAFRNKSESMNVHALMSQVRDSILLNAPPPMTWVISQIEAIRKLRDVIEVVPSVSTRNQSLSKGLRARISLDFKSKDGVNRIGGEASIEFGLLSGSYSICDYKPPKGIEVKPGWNRIAPGLMVDTDSVPMIGVVNLKDNTSWYFEKIMQRQPTRAFSMLLECIKKQFGYDREFGTNFPIKEFKNV